MACVVSSTRRLLVAASSNALEAYDGKEDKLLWKFSGKLIGMDKDIQPVSVDTDNEDTVFVCDKANACVHEFTFTGGYSSSWMPFDEISKSIGCPIELRFNKYDKSFILLHESEDGYVCLSQIEVVRTESTVTRL